MISLALLAGIVGIAGYVPYIRDILRGTTKPDRMSWTIWLLEYVALFAAQISIGAGDALWIVGLQLVGVAAIFGLSWRRYGVGGFTRRDAYTLAGVLGALLLWFATQSGDLAILLLLAVEMVGVVLTALKVYRQPGSETLTFWWCVTAAGVLGLFAVGATAAAIMYVYPAALVIMGLGVVAASYAGARKDSVRLVPELVE